MSEQETATITTSLTATELTELASLVRAAEGMAISITARVDIVGCVYDVDLGYDETGTFGLLNVRGVDSGRSEP